MITEVLLGALRLAHALAAALWIGGTLTYALVQPPAASANWGAFREALRVGIGIFILTGVILAMERLSSATLPPTYMGVLAVKVGLGLWMFALARRIGTAQTAETSLVWWRRPESQVLGLGAVIYGLAVALKSIYEDTIRFRG